MTGRSSNRLRTGILIIMTLVGATTAAQASPQTGDPAFSSVINQAIRMKLDRDREWLAMLHYHPTLAGGLRSHVVEPSFFVSSKGRHDPAAEVKADILHILARDQKFACRFPLRSRWLSRKLDLPPKTGAASCPRLARWVEKTRAASVTLVFPSANMSAPSSMFGHTLLRLNHSTDHAGALLDLSVTFAAEPPEGSSLFRFVSGSISGAFPGRYFMVPYHQKIREYGNIESRDIWEYELDLDPREIRRLVLHLWEIRNVRFTYYFADENCAFRLLELLQVARPSSRLTEQTRFFVTPVDTIRLLRREGFIKTQSYRPSLARRLDRAFAPLSGDERRLAQAVAAHPGVTPQAMTQLQEDRKSAVYLAAFHAMQWQAYRFHQTPDYGAILPHLSKANASSAPSKPKPAPPDHGHPPFRFGIALGQEQGQYLQASIRPAYHDDADPAAGYSPGANIALLETQMRWRKGSPPRLHRLNILEMASLTPYLSYRPSLSWSAGLALQRMSVVSGYHLVGQAHANIGAALDLHALGRLAILPGLALRIHNQSRYRWLKPGIQIRHLMAGKLGSLALHWNTYYSRKAPHTVNDLELSAALALSPRQALRGSVGFRDHIQRRHLDAWAGYAFYW